MTKILLSGAAGHMGKTVTAICEKRTDVEIAAGVDINLISSSFPIYPSINDVKEEFDVIIDFSHPSVFDSLIDYAEQNGKAAVICTTGLSEAQKARLSEAAKSAPIFFSANMSIGINLLIDLSKRAAALLDGFDIELVEKHHNQKLDAPSGTALAIADAISDVLSYEPEYVYDRHSYRKKREKTEIGLHSVRGGTIVGEHDVIFAGRDEVIELKHSAASKEVFAVGAVRAAIFMDGKPNGMYSMSDVINEQ